PAVLPEANIMMKWLWISALVIVLDQLTKVVMANWLELYQTVAVMPYFNFTLAHNSGAAFSFLAGAGGWQRFFFIGLAISVSIVLMIWLSRLKAQAKVEAIAIALIIGGAIGNVIDRFIHGYVIDFIDIYVGSYHWPAFNIADAAICIGAVLLIVDSFKKPAEQK
ncbi:signal peptidase II, partial [Methylophaga sp. UBA4204]